MTEIKPTIGESWKDIEKDLLEDGLPEDEIKTAEKIFYTGAMCMMHLFEDSILKKTISKDFSIFKEELEDYLADFLANERGDDP